ncbi:MAG TPA: hypothetical protein VNS32_00845 [Flavisolibacter sp.]|nr:hypothetical protein [Flavisolibacter sp.]
MAKLILTTFTKEELTEIIKNALQSKPKPDSPIVPTQTWLTRIQASKHLKVCLPKLDKLTKLSKIPVYRIGRKKMYILEEIDLAVKNFKIKYP